MSIASDFPASAIEQTRGSTWRSQAACASVGHWFFHSDNAADHRAARSVCAPCPVRAYCLIAGIGEKYGFWGGQNLSARSALRSRTGIALESPDTSPLLWHGIADSAWDAQAPREILASHIGQDGADTWLDL